VDPNKTKENAEKASTRLKLTPRELRREINLNVMRIMDAVDEAMKSTAENSTQVYKESFKNMYAMFHQALAVYRTSKAFSSSEIDRIVANLESIKVLISDEKETADVPNN